MTGPTFDLPSTVDYNAQMGIGSDVDRQEWELRKQRMRELLDNIKQRQDLAAQLDFSDVSGDSSSTADALVNRAATPPADPDTDYVERNRLFGAAQYYGIAGYDKMPLEALQKIVAAKRLGVERPKDWLPAATGIRVGGQELGIGVANAFIGTVESLQGLAKKVPFIGDHLQERKDWDALNQRLAKFSEGLNNEMSVEQAGRGQTVQDVGNVIGAAVIAWPLWEVAGAVGGGPGLAMFGARMSAIERAVIQGTSVAALMRGGRPEGGAPDEYGMTPKDKEIAMGGAFAGVVTALAPGIGYLANKVRASFPFKAARGAEVPWKNAETVDADWEFMPEGPRQIGSGQKLLKPGEPPSPAEMPPGIRENAPPDVQARIAAAQEPIPGSPPQFEAQMGPHPTDLLPGVEVHPWMRPGYMVSDAAELSGIFPKGAPGVAIEPYAPGAQILKVVARNGEGQPIGSLTLSKTGPNTADSFAVYVEPAFRRQGVATALYDAAEAAGIRVRSGQSGFSVEGQAFTDARATARADATNFTKQATILESPAVMEMSRQPKFDDTDVARSALVSEPASAHVIQGVGNPAEMMQKLTEGGLVPREIRFAVRNVDGVKRTDLLVSNGKPITDTMLQEYEDHGLYTGMQVTHGPAGIEGELVSVNPIESVIRAGGAEITVPTADVLAGRGSVAADPMEVGIPNAPALYRQFKEGVLAGFDTEAVSAGIGPKDWLSPEVASVLPHRIKEFFELRKFDPVQQHALDAYFNKERVTDYQMSQPEAFADMKQALNGVLDAWHNAPAEPPVFRKPVVTAQTKISRINQLGLQGEMRSYVNTTRGQYPDTMPRVLVETGAQDILDHVDALVARGMTEADAVAYVKQNASLLGDVTNSPMLRQTAQRPQLMSDADIAAAERFNELPSGLEGPSVYDLAETKGFIWQNHPGAASGVLLDLNSGDVFPMAHEGAAQEFLKNVNRQVPDHTPISDVPMEIASTPIGAANPGKQNPGPHETQGIVDSYIDHEMVLEEELAQLIADDAAAQIPTHPGVVNDAVLSLPPRVPAPPSGGRPPVPPVQPPAPPSGGAFDGGQPRLPEARPETLGFQFDRARRVQPKNLEEVGNMYDSVVMRFLNPMRSLHMRVTPWLEKLGIDARNLWADGQAIYEGRVRSHNDAHPWMQQARDIFNDLPAGLVRNGTITRLSEIADFNQRMAEMQRMGFSNKQISAVNRLESFNNSFFEKEMVGAMGFNPQQRIFGYMSRVRARQADPRFSGDPYTDAEGHLGPFSWYAEHARVGGLDFREMNAEVLTDHMIRSAMFEKHIAPTWNAMRTAWSDPRIPAKHAEPVLEWLDVVRAGYNPKYQVAIQGVRQVLNSMKIPATDRDVQRMWNFVFRNTYRVKMGFKPAVFFRDSIQPFFAWTRFGNMPEFAGVYSDVLFNAGARSEMLNRGYAGGWIEKGRVRAAVSEAFDPVLNPAGTDQSGSQFRKNLTDVVDYVHDRIPDRFKGGIQGTHADPMHIYGQKLGTLNRLVTGETGWRVATKAIREYAAGDMTMPELLDASGARRSMPTIRDHFQSLVEQGRNEEAANLIAHEWADTQFRGGIAEIPMGNRSLTGRAITMMGNFSVGYVNQMKEGLTAGTVGDRVKFGLRYAAIMLTIGEAERRLKWKGLSSWQWHTALLFAGGPLATASLGLAEAVAGGAARLMDRQPNPDQSQSLRETFGPPSPKADPWQQFPDNVNPYAGVGHTIEGLSGALSGATPGEDAARFLLTGDRRGQGAGPGFKRWYESLPLQGPNRPQLDPHFGRPMPSASLVEPSTPPPQAPAIQSTQGAPAGPLAGESYDQYRRRVLSKTSWSPDTAAISNLNRLRPEVREPLKEMLKAAAAEGVQLDVAETGRRQERQEMLFQKGRTTPGPKVTWTLGSDHTPGRAADLVASTPGGYMWIQKNASRFGFKTMGPSDPGHVYKPAQSNEPTGVRSFLDSLLRAPVTSGGGAQQ